MVHVWKDLDKFDLPEKLTTLWFETRISPTEEELAGIQVPTLFVIGEEEQYIKLDHVAWQYESIPTAEVVWIPDADHAQFVRKPDEVNQALLSFMNRHR